MTRFLVRALLLLTTVTAVVAAQSPAAAEEVVLPERDVATTRSRPNKLLLPAGVLTLGVPYLSSVVVAATSERKSDQHLFVPLAGPWMDLSERSDKDCAAQGQSQNPKCKNEGLYKGMLIANGVFQGLGAIEMIASFVFPDAVTIKSKAPAEPLRRQAFEWRLAPGSVGGGYGLVARGKFF